MAENVLQKAVIVLEGTPAKQTGGKPSVTRAAEMALAGGAAFTGGAGEVSFQVQYNPASLKFQGSAGNRGANGEDNQVISKGSISMSVDLVFHTTGEEDNSVYDTMETVLWAVRTSPTKGIRFSWGNMTVEGELTGFSGTYNMFDGSGRPISGTMSLSIRVNVETGTLDKTMKTMEKKQSDKESPDVKTGNI